MRWLNPLIQRRVGSEGSVFNHSRPSKRTVIQNIASFYMNDISNVNVTDRNQMRTSVKPSLVLYLVSVLLTDLYFCNTEIEN